MVRVVNQWVRGREPEGWSGLQGGIDARGLRLLWGWGATHNFGHLVGLHALLWCSPGLTFFLPLATRAAV